MIFIHKFCQVFVARRRGSSVINRAIAIIQKKREEREH